MINELEVEDFLAHHGIKGQKWGIRKQQLDRISRVAAGTAKRAAIASGHAALITGRATGRGIKKTATFVHDHPRFSASVAAGATFTTFLLKRKIHRNRLAKNFDKKVAERLLTKKLKAQAFEQGMKMSSERVKRSGRAGLEWTKNQPFNLKDISTFQTQQNRLNWQQLL